jgi:cation diffusion facilitator family transporter
MAVSGTLSASKLLVGWIAHSPAVFADGLEYSGDFFGSALVLYALHVASKPPDSDHPHGHGRSETIAGLAVGILLSASAIAICYESVRRLHAGTEIPHFYAIWPMVASIVVKNLLIFWKIQIRTSYRERGANGRRLARRNRDRFRPRGSSGTSNDAL